MTRSGEIAMTPKADHLDLPPSSLTLGPGPLQAGEDADALVTLPGSRIRDRRSLTRTCRRLRRIHRGRAGAEQRQHPRPAGGLQLSVQIAPGAPRRGCSEQGGRTQDRQGVPQGRHSRDPADQPPRPPVVAHKGHKAARGLPRVRRDAVDRAAGDLRVAECRRSLLQELLPAPSRGPRRGLRVGR